MKHEFTTEELISALKEHKIVADAHDAYKNGAPMTAICINNGSRFSPTYYTEMLQEDFDDAKSAADFIAQNLASLPEIPSALSPDIFDDTEYILGNLYIGLEPESDDHLMSRPGPFPNSQQYVYLRIYVTNNGGYSSKIPAEHLRELGITEELAWQVAEANTFAEGETVIYKLEEYMEQTKGPYSYKPHEKKQEKKQSGAESIGEPQSKQGNIGEQRSVCKKSEKPDDGFAIPDEPGVFIVTNRCGTKGAAGVLDKRALKNYFDKHAPGYDHFVSIPSSIHEALVIPTTAELVDNVLARCNELVEMVNVGYVSPVERLSNKCCVLD